MPLSDNHTFGVESLTEAINELPATPSILGDLGIFKKEFKTTTHVSVERKENILTLVANTPRGSVGDPVQSKRHAPKTFNMMHLVKDDIVRADDVQNIRSFGSQNQTLAVAELVNDKMLAMKADIDYTIEHARLGALKGKILDSDGKTVITDIYKEFGMTRKTINWELSGATTQVTKLINSYKQDIAKLRRGESVTGHLCLVSPEFMNTLIAHQSVEKYYARHQDGLLYREGNTDVEFIHNGIKFVVYADEFESGLKLADDEGIILPLGTRGAFFEYYAPADMNSTVNTKALAYYAMREKLGMDKGWELHAQSNPLPLVLRPDLVQTVKLT
ncbi:major capsid protein [Moraxella nonliquefaciens]|jgi:putative bacteriophage protein|uniref:major capsid protein n=1 Tax=Moraxella nonliquefaciens TaxID=478 RepID=UPI001EF47E9F|nr:major capsid protein [Moraxella nonliquefaciens]MCG7412032.1 major capsid protein [Moraxella nonliquefaciens]